MDPSAPPGFDLLFGLFRTPALKDDFPKAEQGDVVILRKIKVGTISFRFGSPSFSDLGRTRFLLHHLGPQYSNRPLKGPTVTGYSNKFSFHVFPVASLLDFGSDIPRSVTSHHPRQASYNGADLDYARYLAKWSKEGGTALSVFPQGVVRSGGKSSRKTVAVSDVQDEVFCNLVVEVSSILCP